MAAFVAVVLTTAAFTAVVVPSRPLGLARAAHPTPRASPAAATAAEPRLVGYENFVRINPLSDRFGVRGFHHLEFVCGDAGTTAARWCAALGMEQVASSSLTNGNRAHASHVVRSGDLVLAFTAPYADDAPDACPTLLGAEGSRSSAALREYFGRHGAPAAHRTAGVPLPHT